MFLEMFMFMINNVVTGVPADQVVIQAAYKNEIINEYLGDSKWTITIVEFPGAAPK